MCLIISKETNVNLPKDEYIIEANLRNPDGIGVAYKKVGVSEVRIKKDFAEVENFLSWLHDNITKEDLCIIHFRLATHGLKDAGNRHPFPVTKNKELLRKTELICQMAMTHNGVLGQYGQHKKFSDTQKFVMDILAEEEIKNNLKSRVVQKLITNYIDGDKLAILDSDGVIYYYGIFHEVDGLKFSNYSYMPALVPITTWMTNWDNEKAYRNVHPGVDWDKIGQAEKQQNNIYLANCDNCGKHKTLKVVELEDGEWMLCKSCRKKAKKGTLDLLVEKQNGYNGKVVCDGCLNWVEEEEMTQIYGKMWCKNCASDVITVNNEE